MFLCPNCHVQLQKTKARPGVFWACPSCDGRSATVAMLRKNVPRDAVNGMWQTARSGAFPRRRECPACDARMAEVPVPIEDGSELVDVCTVCHFVWFDPGERAALPEIPRKPSCEETLPQEARERLALLELDAIRKEAEADEWGGDVPEEGWKWIPAFLGMPVEYDAGGLSRAPLATWLTALTICVVSILAFFNLRDAIDGFGLIPAEAWRIGGLTFVSSFFLHGGVLHLLGNVYFLLVFGDNVEDYLGRWRFLLLLVLASAAGDLAHILGDPSATMPCVGASGGISGVIAFYALAFPRARLGFLVRIYYWVRWLRMPAYAMFLVWVAMQILGTWAQLAGFSNVSSLAHLGGASVGFAFWLATRAE